MFQISLDKLFLYHLQCWWCLPDRQYLVSDICFTMDTYFYFDNYIYNVRFHFHDIDEILQHFVPFSLLTKDINPLPLGKLRTLWPLVSASSQSLFWDLESYWFYHWDFRCFFDFLTVFHQCLSYSILALLITV